VTVYISNEHLSLWMFAGLIVVRTFWKTTYVAIEFFQVKNGTNKP
jgi:hypothetical protein